MSLPAYKVCAVPFCTSTTIKTPNKMFIHVPETLEVRQKWLQLAGRHHATVSPKYSMYYCEDHFDLPKDMENYMKFKLMGSVGKIRMKPNCLPSKFVCQEDQRKRMSSSMSTPSLTKKQKTMLMCNSETTEIEDSGIPSTSGTASDLGAVCIKLEPLCAEEPERVPREAARGLAPSVVVTVKLEPVCVQEPDVQHPGSMKHENSLAHKPADTRQPLVKQEPPWEGWGEVHAEGEFRYEITLEPECVLQPTETRDSPRFPSLASCNQPPGTTSAARPHLPIHPDTQNYVCDACGETFTQKYHLICHIKICLPKKPVIIPKKLKLNSHHRIEITNKPYACKVCQKAFSIRRALMRHERIHTGEKPFTCEVCNKKFTQLGALTQHRRIHTGEKPHTCEICNKEFAQSGSLNRHRQTHVDAGISAYACELCNMEFAHKKHLQIHVRNHTGAKLYSCKMCTKEFVVLHDLLRHQRTHTGEKPFSCDICHKEFTQLGHVNNHKRIHTGEKPYTCELCNKGFSNVSNLKRHLDMHAGTRSFTCEICNKAFTLKNHLMAHIRIHTGEKPYSCEICKKEFARTAYLKLHQRVHTGETPHVCEICKGQFASQRNLKMHKLIHTGEKPHVCEICNKKFTRATRLNSHKRIHNREDQTPNDSSTDN